MLLMFAGSWDPIHLGHVALVSQCMSMGYNVLVGIGRNENKPNRMFSEESMFQAWREIGAPLEELHEQMFDVMIYNGYTAHVAKASGATLVRGLRNKEDFAYEWDVAQFNMKHNGTPTIWLPTPSWEDMALSSTKIREMVVELEGLLKMDEAMFCAERIGELFSLLEKSVPAPVYELICQKVKGEENGSL